MVQLNPTSACALPQLPLREHLLRRRRLCRQFWRRRQRPHRGRCVAAPRRHLIRRRHGVRSTLARAGAAARRSEHFGGHGGRVFGAVVRGGGGRHAAEDGEELRDVPRALQGEGESVRQVAVRQASSVSPCRGTCKLQADMASLSHSKSACASRSCASIKTCKARRGTASAPRRRSGRCCGSGQQLP